MAKAASLRYNARVKRISVQLPPFTANDTKRRLAFVVGAHKEVNASGGVAAAGKPLYALVGADFSTLVDPADADGTLLINVLVYDRSEDAEDTIVSAFDAEVTTVKRTTEMTLVAYGAEGIRTLAEGDAVIVDLVNNSAAIDTNWVEGDAAITFSLLPLDVAGEEFGESLVQFGA